MHESKPSPPLPRIRPTGQLLLERVTAFVLLGVMLSVVWMVLVAYQPGILRLGSVGAEVALVLVLLGAALVLVTLLALLHTADNPHSEAPESGPRRGGSC